MTAKKKGDKGARMEEALRGYVLELGYFVVRAVRFTFQDFHVTDIDLWLYMRPSSLTRERVNVDVKNRRTPQAIERIFWTKGLQQALGLDRSIVATTDRRPAVRDFGRLTDVSVLDGAFLARLSRQPFQQNRMTEEQLVQAIDPDGLAKLKGDWKERIERAKSRLLTHLDYSGCNAWLQDVAFFAEQAVTDAQQREIAGRLFYLTVSFFLIGLDYVFKDISFLDSESKASSLRDGFMHGALGRTGTEKILGTTAALMEGYLPDGKRLAAVLRNNIEASFDQIPADILKEHFGRPGVSRLLFPSARRLEALAFDRSFSSPPDITPDLQAIIGVLLDFSEIERRQFFDSFA
jgi:hypothetical protein